MDRSINSIIIQNSMDQFTVRFKDSEQIYTIPIAKINRFPQSYFASVIHFHKKLECEISACSFDDFAEIYNYIVNDKLDMQTYISNYHLMDYFGIKHNIFDKLIKLADTKNKLINEFISKKNNFLLADSLDEYVVYKEMFSSMKQIVPFQYIMMDHDRISDDWPGCVRDILLCGNGQLCDIGEIKTHRRNGITKQFSHINAIVTTANLNQKSIPIGLPFDWLCHTELERLIDYFNPSSKYPKNVFKDYGFTEQDFDCAKSMASLSANEIIYIIKGIGFVYNRYVDQMKTWKHRLGTKRQNGNLLNSYLQTYDKIYTREYDTTNLSFDKFGIREKIYEDKCKPLIYEKITDRICAPNEDGPTETYPICIEVHFGFINLNSSI